MRVLKVKIRSLREALGEFEEAFEDARAGKHRVSRRHVYFTSMEALRNLLTPERLKLLSLIRRHKPRSIYELAQFLDRDFKNVYEDVKLLERHGILDTGVEESRDARKGYTLDVPYDQISVEIPLGTVSEASVDFGDSTDDASRRARRNAQEKYRPQKIRYLLIAESPPSDPSRYFYFENVKARDALFLETMKALYPSRWDTAANLRRQKKQFLDRFRDDGFYLLDAVEVPLGRKTSRQKVAEIRGNIPDLIRRVHALIDLDTPIALISAPVFQVCDKALRARGYAVANDEMIDFPSSGRQKAFRAKFAKVLGSLGWPASRRK